MSVRFIKITSGIMMFFWISSCISMVFPPTFLSISSHAWMILANTSTTLLMFCFYLRFKKHFYALITIGAILLGVANTPLFVSSWYTPLSLTGITFYCLSGLAWHREEKKTLKNKQTEPTQDTPLS